MTSFPCASTPRPESTVFAKDAFFSSFGMIHGTMIERGPSTRPGDVAKSFPMKPLKERSAGARTQIVKPTANHQKHTIEVNPNKAMSTSCVERSDLTTRMRIRLFTKLTSALSRRISNHLHILSLQFLYDTQSPAHDPR